MFDYSEFFDFNDKKLIQEELDCVANQNLDLFEDSIKETIDRFEKKYNDYCTKENEINEEILICNNIDFQKFPEKINENNQLKKELHEKRAMYLFERYRIKLQLKSMSEMLIINAFKNIEINIKTLIKIGYPKVNSKEFYKWELLVQFFKSLKIDLKSIQGYREVFNIKDINNSLKHTGIPTDEIKKIEEFTGQIEYDFVNLINFYDRVKSEIPVFLTELSNKIKQDLFDFNETRIEEICKDYKLRMNDDDIKIFINKLSEK